MSGGGGSTTRPSPVESAVAKELTTSLFPSARNLFNQGTQGIYQGSRLADESALSLQARKEALGQIPQLEGFSQNLATQFQPLLSTDVGGIEDTFLGTVEAEGARQSQLTSGLIDQLGIQAGRQFERNILPALGDQAQAAGQFGSSRQGIAEGVAAEGVQTNLNAQIAGLLQSDVARQDAIRESALNRAFGERSGQLGRALQASTLAPQIQQNLLAPSAVLEQLGLAEQQRSGFELEDRIRMFEDPRMAELRRLQEFQGLIGYQGPQQFSQQQVAGKGSAGQGAIGGALAGGYIAGSVGAAIGGVAGLLSA